MGKCPRVCVEARDVYASRQLRRSEGVVLDPATELHFVGLIADSIVDAGLFIPADVYDLSNKFQVHEGGIVISQEHRIAFGDHIREKFIATIGSSNRQELSIFNSVLPAVVSVFVELVALLMVHGNYEENFPGRRLHQSHDVRLTNFEECGEIRYLESMYDDDSAAISAVE